MTYSFNSKESYLQYRAAWKQRYAALSADIRELKFCRKSLATIERLGGTERYERMKKAYSTAWGFCPPAWCYRLRQQATEMLAELKLAKAEAQRQYLEAQCFQTTK